MTIQQLKYFLKVCDSGSMAKAAEELFLSHQALSKSIRLLERELSCPLFRRTGTGLVLTEHGKLLRQRAQGMVESFECFCGDLARAFEEIP